MNDVIRLLEKIENSANDATIKLEIYSASCNLSAYDSYIKSSLKSKEINVKIEYGDYYVAVLYIRK